MWRSCLFSRAICFNKVKFPSPAFRGCFVSWSLRPGVCGIKACMAPICYKWWHLADTTSSWWETYQDSESWAFQRLIKLMHMTGTIMMLMINLLAKCMFCPGSSLMWKAGNCSVGTIPSAHSHFLASLLGNIIAPSVPIPLHLLLGSFLHLWLYPLYHMIKNMSICIGYLSDQLYICALPSIKYPLYYAGIHYVWCVHHTIASAVFFGKWNVQTDCGN